MTGRGLVGPPRAGRALAGAALLLTLGACAQDPTDPASSTPTSNPNTETSMTSTSPPSDRQDAAATDLATRLGIDPADIVQVSQEAVTWRDSSLGCPHPGRVYGQTLVEGHRIVLRARGREYTYHSGGSTAPFLCEDPQEPAATS